MILNSAPIDQGSGAALSRHKCRHQRDICPRRIASAEEPNTLARTNRQLGAIIVLAADANDSTAEYSAVIYLSGIDEKQLDEAERRCRDYASRFGWHVLESIRDTSPGQLLAKAASLRAQVILTGSPDMISPDEATRNDLMMATERAGCIVHPLSTPCRS